MQAGGYMLFVVCLLFTARYMCVCEWVLLSLYIGSDSEDNDEEEDAEECLKNVRQKMCISMQRVECLLSLEWL